MPSQKELKNKARKMKEEERSKSENKNWDLKILLFVLAQISEANIFCI